MDKKNNRSSYKQEEHSVYCIICDKNTELKDIEVEYNNKEIKLNGCCSECGTEMSKIIIPINNE